MQFNNLACPEQKVSFRQALLQGIGRDNGLFFPEQLEPLANIEQLLEMPFVERSVAIYQQLLQGEFSQRQIAEIVTRAFNFALPLKQLGNQQAVLELFHGPTLAFKDFGCRFFAECIAAEELEQPITIVTATSGDTGAAVAHAFYQNPKAQVHVLYPKGKISRFQELLFCTLGDNIHTYAVDGDFDACQAMVKQVFVDPEIRHKHQLNSANSINVSRLLAQVSYYFEIAAQARQLGKNKVVVSVPSGNFGNLTAGLMAKALGAPISRFVIGCNANDTVPRYLDSGQWQPNPTIETLANAMDISQPNNWPRVAAICKQQGWHLNDLTANSFSDAEVKHWIKKLDELGYLAEPHTAIAYAALNESLATDEYGVFLATAHPAKFSEVVTEVLAKPVQIPKAHQECMTKPLLSKTLSASFSEFKQYLS